MHVQGALMIEHRLIERMIKIIERKLAQIKKEHKADPAFIDSAVDFIRTYADRTHHGKEEDILFRDLAGKNLSEDDSRMMKDLIEEHVFARKTTKALADANNWYRQGESAALADIIEQLRTLVDFYPKHIDKEDRIFFPSSRKYLSEQEDQTILTEFEQFDKKMIHEKYETVVDLLETA